MNGRSPVHDRSAPRGRLQAPTVPRWFLPRLFACAWVGILCFSTAVLAQTNSNALEEIPPLRPPRAEIPPTFWELHHNWVIAAGVAVCILIFLAAWLLTRPKPVVPVPPDVQARAALERLRSQPENGAVLSAVSQTLRHYFTAVFSLPSHEYTTTEFCRAIQGHDQVGPELATALTEFLRHCDNRKFAPPAPAPALGAVPRALELIATAEARLAKLRESAALAAQPGPSGEAGA